jgi:membrane protease YdiL (CAAX protease family)
MNIQEKNNKGNGAIQIVELLFVVIALTYFLGYPRNTISDFIVLPGLCLLVIFMGTKFGLTKPAITKFSKADSFLIGFSLVLFVGSWFVGFYKGLVNVDSALKAVNITIVYFYYAWIQHFLAQRYMALRFLNYNKQQTKNAKLTKHAELYAALMTGFVFGVLHIPYPRLILPAMIGGFIYAYYFLTTGRLWAVVTSHALVSSAGIFWLLEVNPFREFVGLL